MNELARHEALKQFLEVVIGKRKPTETKSNILDHKMSVEIMSLIYKIAVILMKQNLQIIIYINYFFHFFNFRIILEQIYFFKNS